MKKFLLLLTVLLLVCTSCIKSDEEPVNMEDLLKISTTVMEKDVEGTGRWGYNEDPNANYGYWIPKDGVTQLEYDDIFVKEELEVGVPRIMAPMSFGNLRLTVEYDGLVKVSKIEPTGSSIRLVDMSGDWYELEEIQTNGPCKIMICPVGRELVSEGTERLMCRDTLVDKEYTLQICGCTNDGTPVVTAVVKITAIPDPEYPWETVHDGHYSELYVSGEERTRFCSIELVSYTYSEMYLLMGEEQ